jgi:hypothetical protein
MSVFEIIMLLCFGSAWPFSIYKSWTSGTNEGKSLWFMIIVLVGYLSGVIHKILHNLDPVVYLYGANGVMVLMDIALYFRNRLVKEKGRALFRIEG